jgi:hypothetical protein
MVIYDGSALHARILHRLGGKNKSAGASLLPCTMTSTAKFVVRIYKTRRLILPLAFSNDDSIGQLGVSGAGISVLKPPPCCSCQNSVLTKLVKFSQAAPVIASDEDNLLLDHAGHFG